MKSKNNWLYATALVVITSVAAISCEKKFSEPPVMGNPDVVANITIRDVKARYNSGVPVAITDDAIIEGIVSGDDRSGNYYQQIAIQDATGGVLLRLAGNNLFNNYPVGRKVFVKLKGLYLGQYNGTLQFGGGVDTPYINQGGVTLLAPNLQAQHLIKGPLNQPLVPQVVTVSQLTTNIQDKYVSTLIKLEGFEFAASELGKNYADDAQSGNRIIQGCTSPSTNRITLRTSNFANFATLRVAQGNGDIIGIYSFFGSTKQFTIRDTTDVRFYGPRCPTAAGNGSITLTSSPLTLNFDNIASGLPTGVYVKENATSLDLGTDGTVFGGNFTSPTVWNNVSAGFKNFASATGLTSAANTATQNASTNRALGVRQTGAVGDPGAAFAFQLANTTGKSNLKLDFLLQALDPTAAAGRTTTWRVDYGVGQSPAGFTTVTTIPATLTTVYGAFASTPVTVNFGSALNNISQPVWIRIVALNGTTGGGNRTSTAIDDVKFTWN